MAHRSSVGNCSAAAVTCRMAARTLAIIDLIRPTSACIGVRYSSVCPPWLTARPTARQQQRATRQGLASGVGRAVSHGAQTLLYLTPMHAEVGLIKLKLPRFRGHFSSRREGVRDACIQAAVRGGVS